jgi:hypothetical protein
MLTECGSNKAFSGDSGIRPRRKEIYRLTGLLHLIPY